MKKKQNYIYISDFIENIAFFTKRVHIKGESKNKYGFINKEGQEIIPPIYDSCKNFNKGIARVSIKSKYGFINK